MNGERVETDWVGKRAVECRLIAEQSVAYRGERFSGIVLLRGRSTPKVGKKHHIEVEVSLRDGTSPTWYLTPTGWDVDFRRLGRVPPLGPDEERAVSYELCVPKNALARPGLVVATVRSGRWHHWRLAEASLPVRIGPQRSVEGLILDLATLAEAEVHSWNTRIPDGSIRARLKPVHPGARYRAVIIEARVIGDRAKGILSVSAASGRTSAYEIDLRLSDRMEYQHALWQCLSRHLDRSGQLPIPAAGHRLPIEALPLPFVNLPADASD